MAKYPRITQKTDDGFSDWIKPKRRGYRMACCDCGLVHEMDFDYVKWGKQVRIIFRARRHNRATAAVRRYKKPAA